MVSELLSIQTDIDHVERIVIVKEWYIRELVMDILLGISPLNANPILNFGVCFGF